MKMLFRYIPGCLQSPEWHIYMKLVYPLVRTTDTDYHFHRLCKSFRLGVKMTSNIAIRERQQHKYYTNTKAAFGEILLFSSSNPDDYSGNFHSNQIFASQFGNSKVSRTVLVILIPPIFASTSLYFGAMHRDAGRCEMPPVQA